MENPTRQRSTSNSRKCHQYNDGINFGSLKAQLQVLCQILKDEGAMECFDDVLCEVIKKLNLKKNEGYSGEVVIVTAKHSN